MMEDPHKQALAIQGEFIALGLIKEISPGAWRLTEKGLVEAEAIFNRLIPREQALLLLFCKTELGM